MASIKHTCLYHNPQKCRTESNTLPSRGVHASNTLTAERDEAIFVLVLLHESSVIDSDVRIRHRPWVGFVLFLLSDKHGRKQLMLALGAQRQGTSLSISLQMRLM